MSRPIHSTNVILVFALLTACGDDELAAPDDAQAPPIFATYGFTSGAARGIGTADGFDWPKSPPGMVDDFPSSTFTTPDGVRFFHDIGNNLFFDDAHLLPDEAAAGTGIEGDAMWGQARPINHPILEAIIVQFEAVVDRVSFDLAWAVGGDLTPAEVELAVSEEYGFGEFVTFPLIDAFDAGQVFQNAVGYSGRVEFSLESLSRDHDVHLSGIRHISIFVNTVSTEGGRSAFAIDNFEVSSPE